MAIVEFDAVVVSCLAVAVAISASQVVVAVVAVISQVGQSEASGLLLIVCPDQALTISTLAADAVSGRIATSPGLHAQTSLQTRYHIGAGSVASSSACAQSLTMGVTPRQV